MKKKIFYTEAAYIVGLLLLALGTALMERADFGMSMVVAPAYLLHLKLSPVWPVFTFGMAEYVFQAVLLALMCLVLRSFRPGWLFSFATAVIYGLLLDTVIYMVGQFPAPTMVGRCVCYVLGLVICAAGVSMLFHTYIAPEVYELCVKTLSERYGWDIHRTKTVYDCASCLLGVVLSFAFFGFGVFEGVKLGTILCALVNGATIGVCSRFLEKHFDFVDAKPWRPAFERQ